MRVDIWHPGGFHGNQDSIQDGRPFLLSILVFLHVLYLNRYKYFKIVVIIHGAFKQTSQKGHQRSRSLNVRF